MGLCPGLLAFNDQSMEPMLVGAPCGPMCWGRELRPGSMVQGCCEPWPGMLRDCQSCMALNVALPGALGVVWVFGGFLPASTASLTF